MKVLGRYAGLVLLLSPALNASSEFASSCENLAALMIPDSAVTSAVIEQVKGLPARTGGSAEFCRVKVVSRPVPDSEIHFEVWLPSSEMWNGKLLGTGNGGYSGDLSLTAMEAALKRGYATAGSDTGHQGGDLKFGAGHPEKIKDWSYRAVHVMTEGAKLVIRNYYGRFPKQSYFTGCSTGGHQALSEAQRYPSDYDGIIAGDPGNNRIRLNIGFLWSWIASHEDPSAAFPASKLPMLNRAVIAACDTLDGVRDGLIDDPRRCKFDPGELLCKGTADESCLTAAEVSSVRKIYDGARNPRTEERIFGGWERGSEAGWAGYFVGHPEPARTDFWRYWVFHNPAWDPASFDFDQDVSYAESELGMVVADNPDLASFKKRKGKLIVYHGWADPVAPPEDTIRYYEKVQGAMGGAGTTTDFVRLFMVPGMAHCAGGPGPNTFDMLEPLDSWVTQNKAPGQIIATHSTNGHVDRTRPLCPYPQVARWNGSGSIDDAASFVCASPPKGSR